MRHWPGSYGFGLLWICSYTFLTYHMTQICDTSLKELTRSVPYVYLIWFVGLLLFCYCWCFSTHELKILITCCLSVLLSFCKVVTFSSFSLEVLGQLQANLAHSIYRLKEHRLHNDNILKLWWSPFWFFFRTKFHKFKLGYWKKPLLCEQCWCWA